MGKATRRFGFLGSHGPGTGNVFINLSQDKKELTFRKMRAADSAGPHGSAAESLQWNFSGPAPVRPQRRPMTLLSTLVVHPSSSRTQIGLAVGAAYPV